MSETPDRAALLGALPQPAALLDGAARLAAANPAFAAALPGPAPWDAGADVPFLLPEAAEAIGRALGGQAARVGIARAGHSLDARPCPPGVLLLLTPLAEGDDGRLEILGRLAGGIAHDFNNLLGVVMGAAAAAREAGAPEAVRHELEAIEAAATRGGDLVRQLLAFARRQVLTPQVLALNDSVAGSVAILRRLLGPGVALETRLEAPTRHIRVDPSQWQRVLINLAVNARDAMGGKGRISFATGRRLVLAGEMVGGELLPPGRYVTLEVRDSGPGIPPEALPRLFEPFFTTKLEAGGTGLGLATVQGIVAQSGGRIEVESPPGGGACFRILLPRADPPPATAAPQPAARAPVPVPAAAEGPVMLVDDERTLLRVAGLALRQAGHAVLAHEDALDALEAIETGPRPAALVTDIAMPGCDGLDLARAARARWPDLPVLLLSGYSAASVEGAPAREGFRLLAKPFTAEALRAALAEALATAGPTPGIACDSTIGGT